MRCNFIQTLDGIEAMENLEVVNFSYNKLTDVSSLFKCPKIREICLAFNFELSDLGCDYAPNVADLDIPFTKVEKAPVIGVGAENVWFVSNNTRVTDFSCLRAVKSFDWLAVGGSVKSNLLSNIKGKEIHKLGWEGADIESMQELADSGIVFTGQGYLNINHSNLKSLEGIENIKGNIKWLNLFETKQLTDMSPIQNLPNLISLGYDSRFESGEVNVKEYCETNHIRTFSTYNYYKYDFWMNEPQE